ncbi:MAG: hypothetical protein KatS3mg057_2155 [Herpetosiphonaceae bacterium]|nr:MAG: hypothetical protein KatS3mg057_2155 [Herpetosiphonaceae bacterium]
MRSFSLFDLLIALLLLIGACAGPLLPRPAAHTTFIHPSTSTADEIFSLQNGSDQNDHPIFRGQALYTRFDSTLQRGELWSAELDGSGSQRILTGSSDHAITDLAISPDGSQIAYVEASRGRPGVLHLAAVDGTSDRILADDVALIGPHAFSPDGTLLAFVRYRQGEAGPESGAIWVIETVENKPGKPRQVSPWYGLISAPAWANARTLLFSAAPAAGSGATLYRADIGSGTEVEPLTAGWLHDLSPDRQFMLVFFQPGAGSDDAQLFDYAIIPLEDGEARPVRRWQWPLGLTSWSPDGASIALISEKTGQLHMIDVASGEQEQFSLADGRAIAGSVAWTPDSRGLLYIANIDTEQRTAELRLLDLDSVSERSLVTLPAADLVLVAVMDKR